MNFQHRLGIGNIVLTLTGLIAVFAASAQSPGISSSIVDSTGMPEVFAPGVVSSPYTEWATSFSPDGNTVYFSRGAVYWTLVSSERKGDRWSTPVVLPFSGRYRETDPFITPDGRRLFFMSYRPVDPSSTKPMSVTHLWYADRQGESWGEPHHLEAPVNLDNSSCFAPSVSSRGTLFFCARDREGHEGMQSYTARFLNGHFEKPVLVHVPGVTEIQDPFIAPDESYLIFLSGTDLYISYFRQSAWSTAERLSAVVNNGDYNSSPAVSPDGKMLYYSSGRIKGFYKRDPQSRALNFDELTKENESIFNSQMNILRVPIHLPKA